MSFSDTTVHELAAFAFVEEEYRKTGDIISGLAPLFTPIFAKSPNKQFDAKAFAKEVRERYGLAMTQVVAEGLIPKLIESGYLYPDRTNDDVIRIKPVQRSAPTTTELELNDLLADFAAESATALKKIGQIIDAERLKDGLLARLSSTDFLAILERPTKNFYRGNTLTLKPIATDDSSQFDVEQAIDVLSADYTLGLYEKDIASFEKLRRISGGSLISEVVLTLQEPSSVDSLKAGVILDGPLILDFLDLSSPELHDFSVDLFGLINGAKLKKYVFAHLVDEMRAAIRGPLEALQRGDTPTGPLGMRILADKNHATYARVAMETLEGLLAENDIEIIDADRYRTPDYQTFCSEALEDSLRNCLGALHYNLERRIVDAASVATVMRLRGSRTHPRDLTDTDWVFVSRNPRLVQYTNELLILKGAIEHDDLPPALTDRQLAGSLWFCVGGSIGSLTKKKLIANCLDVLHPRIDVNSKMRQYLLEIGESQAKMYAALMRDGRAQRCLVHRTLGFSRVVTYDSAPKLLEEMRLSTAEEVQTKADAEQVRLRQEYQNRLDKQGAAHTEEIQNRETEILGLKSALKDHSNTVTDLSGQIAGLAAEKEADYERRVTSCEKDSRLFAYCIAALLAVAYAVLTGVVYMRAPYSPRFGLVATVILSFFGFWFIPGYLFGGLVRFVWRRAINRNAKSLLLQDYLRLYEIDQKQMRLIKKS